MSQFEFVVVLFSLVVAFGVSEILEGWGRSYENRDRVRPYPLQVVASGLLLIALLQSVWGYWGFRGVTWTFGLFLLSLAPLLTLVGAAYLITPAVGGGEPSDSRAHYYAVAPGVFILLASWVALGTVAEISLVDSSFHLGQAVRILAVAVLLALSRSSNPAHHWCGLICMAGLQLAFVWIVTPGLS